MNVSKRQQQIALNILLGFNSPAKLSELEAFNDITTRTIQRDLSILQDLKYISRSGEGRGVYYTITTKGLLSLGVGTSTLEDLFSNEDRPVVEYSFDKLTQLASEPLFSDEELERLVGYDNTYKNSLSSAPEDIIRRERERITIELSWKSSAMEGNTYSLLETETLLKEGIPAQSHSEFETNMIINHKKSLDFSSEHSELFRDKLTVHTIVELHKLLVENLGISHTLRNRMVSITGSTYRPLANPHKIREELERFCEALNSKTNVYEKSLLAYFFIPYLQPFNDGNKRTGRICANALLFANGSFPLSLRAVDPNEYKIAMLAFYELGVLGPLKRTYLDQAEYAKNNYLQI